MKTTRFLSSFFALGALTAASAGTCVHPPPAQDDKEKSVVECAPPLVLGTLTLGTQFSAQGSGGYLDAITGLWQNRDHDFAVLLSSRYHLEDSDEFISSTGLAVRKLLPERQIILGANVFYDSIDSEHDHHFDQLGLGLEVLTHYVDWHFNYYLPESGSKTFGASERGGGTFAGFETGLEGLNTEVGFLLPGLDRYMEVRFFGGYYHYNNSFGQDYEGFKARLEARLLPGVIADVEYWQTAVLMEGHWTAGVRVSVPFSLFNLAKGRNPFEGAADAFRVRTRAFPERMGEMIMRSPRIQTVSSGGRLVAARDRVGSDRQSLPPGPPPVVPFPRE